MNQISAYVDSELPDASIELVRLHLSSCLECAERFGHLEEQEEALGRLLVNDPGDGFFADFADQVLSYMPQREVAPAKHERAPSPPPARPAAPPARHAPPSTEVSPIMSTEPAPKPPREPRPPKPVSHRARHAVLAGSLVLVLSALAIVVGRRGMMDSPSTTWILDHLDPTSWFGSGAPRGTPGSGGRDSDKAGGSPAESTRSYPTVVDSGVLDRAAARSAMAESVGSPEAYDAAAEAWLDALPLLANDPEELASGRREVASARYVAWSLLPTPERRAAALEAVRTYLLVAPPGNQRDLAWKWLSRLKR
jgi:putative zinc finger protein